MAAAKGNKYALGNKGGRPPMYENAKLLEKRVRGYFKYCEGEYHDEERERVVGKGKDKTTEKYKVNICDRPPERPTWTGLALFLGFESRQSLTDYVKKEEFSYTIKRASLTIENIYEEALTSMNTSGPIFALKNYGWKDKTEVDNNIKFGADLEESYE
jgi:hypothetical protein